MNTNLVIANRHVALKPAMACLDAGLAKAEEVGVRVSIVIVDPQGRPVVLVRMDRAMARSDDEARGKATMAAGLGVPTGDFIENRLKQNEPLWRAMSSRPGSFIVEGGFPLKLDGKSVGGVGVSGAKPEEDALVSRAVAEAWDKLAS